MSEDTQAPRQPEAKTRPRPRQPLTRGLLFLILVLYLIDQGSKWWIVSTFKLPFIFPGGGMAAAERVPVISDGWGLLHFSILRVHNTGVAFGMGNGTAWASYVFLAVPVLALAGLFVLYRRGFFETRTMRIAWALITAGILGNLTDRLTQGFFLPGGEGLTFWEKLMRGYVVDFLDVSFPWITSANWPHGYHWPAFNVADSCICIAAGIFFVAGWALDVSKRKSNQPH